MGGIPELHHFSFNFYESKIGIRAVSTLEFSDFFMASSMTFDTAVLLFPTQYRHLSRPSLNPRHGGGGAGARDAGACLQRGLL